MFTQFHIYIYHKERLKWKNEQEIIIKNKDRK